MAARIFYKPLCFNRLHLTHLLVYDDLIKEEEAAQEIVDLIDTVLTAAAANLDLIAGKTEEGREAYEEVLASVRKMVRMKTTGMPLNRY